MAGLSSFLEQPDYRVLVPFADSSLDVALAAVLPVARSATSFASRNSRSRAMFLRMFTAASSCSESALVHGVYSIQFSFGPPMARVPAVSRRAFQRTIFTRPRGASHNLKTPAQPCRFVFAFRWSRFLAPWYQPARAHLSRRAVC